MSPRSFVIAIDGPAAAGKGTLARRLAATLGFAFLETGLLYRAVGLALLREGADLADEAAAVRAAKALRPADLSDPALREDAAANAASKISAIPAVRAALVAFQRDFAARPPGGASGAVLDGRDIGTAICPDADVKLFVTARVEIRARRRLMELRQRGLEAIDTRVLADMQERDARDSLRAASPLVAAGDAIALDTSDLDPETVFARALAIVEQRRRPSGGG